MQATSTRWQKQLRRFSKPRPCRSWPTPAIIIAKISRLAKMTASKPICRRTKATASSKQGRFVRKDFSYDAATNTYRCPAGQRLHPTKKPWTNLSGRIESRYLGSKASCGGCALKASCLSPEAKYRSVSRWEHEDVLDRHRQRMASEDAAKLMRRRSAIVEHPFGTLKCRAGYQHFLVRGFDKVRGEWSLMALCYNFTRLLNILGFDRFVAYMAEKACVACKSGFVSALRAILLVSRTFQTRIAPSLQVVILRATPAS